jgi:hypothetical protein
MGMTERLLAAWREAAAAMDATVEGSPEWERARLAVHNASMAYQFHVAQVFDDVSGHAFDPSSEPADEPADQPPERPPEREGSEPG